MNARTRPPQPARTRLRPMRQEDLDAVLDIELRAYPFPWTRGIFEDCLRAAYPAWVLEAGDDGIIGYAMLTIAADEAHILNVCASPDVQGQGHGRHLLRTLLRIAHSRGAQRVFLEVRPTNTAAIGLYHAEGFNEIGRRPRYYPAKNGREDAIVMAKELFAEE
jgi:[ribosomal protein S18]-alanine N-acetyltransferase